MSNTEINRQIVRNGLTRRATTAKEREAALEAVGREFRAGINQHSQNIRNSLKAAEEAKRRKEAQEKKAAKLRKLRAEQEAKEVDTWYAIYAITLGPMLLASAAISLCNAGMIPFWIMALIAIPASMYGTAALIVNLSVHCKLPRIGAKRIRKAIEKIQESVTIR